jgi:hypothetical protein
MRSSRVHLSAVAAVLLGLAALAQAEPADRTRGGLAFQVGAGSFTGGLGAVVEYQIRLARQLRVTPFVGGGATTATEQTPALWAFGYAGGAALEAGSFQRAFVAVGFGTQGVTTMCDVGQPCTNERVIHGPFAVLGYKGTAPFGLMWMVYYGASVALDDPVDKKVTVGPAMGVGLGWKL